MAAVALQCFLNEVARHVPGCLSQSGLRIFYQYREEFLKVVDGMSDNTQQNVACFAREWHLAQPGEGENTHVQAVQSDLYFRCARKGLCPSPSAPAGNPQEQLYCEAWLELRQLLLKRGVVDSSTRALLALDQHFVEDGGDGSEGPADKKLSAWKYIDELYQQSLARIADEIPSRLGIYETVMREIPPDLFDIGCVMRGRPNHERAKQYLWQMHSIRSDKLFYSHRLPGKADWIDGNIIRIGMVLDHLLFGTLDEERIKTFNTRKSQIEDYLQQWYGNETHRSGQQQQERDKNRRAIANDYASYTGESLFANVMLGSYTRRITEQLRNIWEMPDLNNEIDRLSGFYFQYYNALDSADEDACATALFDLSIQMIETYQCQPNLRQLCNDCDEALNLKAAAVMSHYPTAPFDTNMYKILAFHPGELFHCIMEISRSMRLDWLHAQLWYRGQRLEQRNLLPTIMRKPEKADTKYVLTEGGFLYRMRRMMTLAKAKILHQGSTYSKAEWLALLQHHDFHTNLLDWSEDFLTALFFAIERWEENPSKPPEGDAAVAVLNPVLLNLACDMLDKRADKDKNKAAYKAALDRLCNYLKSGSDKGETSAVPLFDVSTDEGVYREYFDLTADFSKKSGRPIRRPIAAMTPINNDRMRAQAGMFTFCDIRAKPEKGADGALTYEAHDLMNIQGAYVAALRAEARSCPAIPKPVPFLLKIILNCANYQVFTQYLRAMNVRKYKVYPELNNLAADIMGQSF